MRLSARGGGRGRQVKGSGTSPCLTKTTSLSMPPAASIIPRATLRQLRAFPLGGRCSNGGDGVAEGGQEAIAPPPTSNLHSVPSPRVSYRARNTVGSNYGRGTNVDELSAAEYVVCVCVKRHVCRKRGWRGYILRVRVSRETQRKIGLLFEGQHGGCAEDRFTGERSFFWLLLLLFHTFLYSFCFISSLCPPLFPAPFSLNIRLHSFPLSPSLRLPHPSLLVSSPSFPLFVFLTRIHMA